VAYQWPGGMESKAMRFFQVKKCAIRRGDVTPEEKYLGGIDWGVISINIFTSKGL